VLVAGRPSRKSRSASAAWRAAFSFSASRYSGRTNGAGAAWGSIAGRVWIQASRAGLSSSRNRCRQNVCSCVFPAP
jgi:hypothetical protein